MGNVGRCSKLTLLSGLGRAERRESGYSRRSRQPRELFGREQRRNVAVHRIVGFDGTTSFPSRRLFNRADEVFYSSAYGHDYQARATCKNIYTCLVKDTEQTDPASAIGAAARPLRMQRFCTMRRILLATIRSAKHIFSQLEQILGRVIDLPAWAGEHIPSACSWRLWLESLFSRLLVWCVRVAFSEIPCCQSPGERVPF